MVHNTLVGGQDDETELTGGEHGVGEVLELVELEIETGGDNTALVEATVEVNNNLASAGIVDDGELVDVALGLHQTEDLDKDLGDGVEDNLTITVRYVCLEGREETSIPMEESIFRPL